MGAFPARKKHMICRTFETAATWSSTTTILWGQVDMEMGVWVGVSLARGKEHGNEKKARGVHCKVVLRSVWPSSS